MDKKTLLVLEDGSVYEGYSFGAETEASGEVVFNTSMTGYQEILTDPSYAGQIVVPTYPLIGNYGINQGDSESRRIQVRGFVVREECYQPSHYLGRDTLDGFLKKSGIPGIHSIDTRALTRRLRSAGVMMGLITHEAAPEAAITRLRALPSYGSVDYVREVTAARPYDWPSPPEPKYRVVVLDCGLKYNILRLLTALGCQVTAVPCTTPAADILAMRPDGILLSPGPGDPELLDYLTGTVKALVGRQPVMGICLGSQLIARAFGGRNYKLKFGHRGGNHPVKDLADGSVRITAQNHGYAVDPDSLKGGLEVSHVSLNDGTVEGVRHRELGVFAIQYHSEASPGPLDSVYLFEEFIRMMGDEKAIAGDDAAL